ncbi:hypothetical protein [Hyalangium sp.]|uniref:hypothetical protein n=1 Tax=Hyalangium sp. TaxID=2028555 RepID=UPI002D59E462|nr:hypothetical protein [Hyalangium sp.]HYH97618.1 hypothetical protein [Hyalangium sp.]
MTFPAKHELVRTVREMARTRKVVFDHSGAFLFNRTHLNEPRVVDILCNATEGVVTIHHDKGSTSTYSVLSHVEGAEIFLDADIRTELIVRSVEPLS